MTNPNRKLAAAKNYGSVELARINVGPAITSMAAASTAIANGNTDEDITDAIGSAMVRLHESFELLREAHESLKEIQRVSKETASVS